MAERGEGGVGCVSYADSKMGPTTPLTTLHPKPSAENTYSSADALVKTVTELASECARELYWILPTSVMKYKFPFSMCNVCKPVTLLK